MQLRTASKQNSLTSLASYLAVHLQKFYGTWSFPINTSITLQERHFYTKSAHCNILYCVNSNFKYQYDILLEINSTFAVLLLSKKSDCNPLCLVRL